MTATTHTLSRARKRGPSAAAAVPRRPITHASGPTSPDPHHGRAIDSGNEWQPMALLVLGLVFFGLVVAMGPGIGVGVGVGITPPPASSTTSTSTSTGGG